MPVCRASGGLFTATTRLLFTRLLCYVSTRLPLHGKISRLFADASTVAFPGPTDFVPELNCWLPIAACMLPLKGMDGIIGLSNDKIAHLARAQMESNLRFADFFVFHCPLKEDAVEMLITRLQSPCSAVLLGKPSAICAVRHFQIFLIST